MISPELAEVIVISVIGVIIIQGIWLAFVTYMMYSKKRAEEERARKEELDRLDAENNTTIEDIFLLHRSGLLLKHYTRRLRPNVDSDVLSGMLVAVQEFIKDSFRGEKGALDEIHFGELRILVVEGKWTIVACILRGKKPVNLQPQILIALSDIEDKYSDLLMNWDGTLDAAPEVDTIMHRLISGDYKGTTESNVPRVEKIVAT